MRGRNENGNGNGNGNDKENGDGSYTGFVEMGETAVKQEEEAASGSAAPIFPPYLEATEPTDEEKRVNRANAGGI
jgi:hypothetical protein